MNRKILCVDDEPKVLLAYERGLRASFDVDSAVGGKEALRLVASKGPYAVIVSDLRMPRMSGLELLKTMKQRAPDTIRIMLTGNADQRAAVDAVNEGQIFRFLTKPCPIKKLTQSLEEGLVQFQRAGQLEDSSDLAVRQAFEGHLHRALQAARLEQTENALCYIDIDQFNVVNDTCGHQAGDRLLRCIEAVIHEYANDGDAVARIGGSEFAWLMQRCPLSHAWKAANELCGAIEKFHFIHADRTLRLGASIGLVPLSGTTSGVVEVLSAAGSACHTARDGGGNRVHVYYEGDLRLERRSAELRRINEIHNAIDEGRLLLYYQPILSLHPQDGLETTDRVMPDSVDGHFEVLVRMQDEAGALVSADGFLPVAERHGITPRIDRWVVKATFDYLAGAPERLASLKWCSINLSGLSLGEEEFLHFLVSEFERTRVPPEKICFEVTETAAIANLSRAIRMMSALKALGCRFALDDFGSGLSSFAYLKSLPVDIVKIDGRFVEGIADDLVDCGMVRSINDISHLMGKLTVAEFVQDNEVLERLREMGVDYAQGFLIGRPHPIEQMMLGTE